MDRIDEIIYRFNSERKETPEKKKMLWMISILAIMVLSVFIAMILWDDYIKSYLVYGFTIIFIVIVILMLLPYWYAGSLGTKKRKSKMIVLRRKRFLEEQYRLVNIIRERGMTPQQVYNILGKKKDRVPPNDKKVYIISISSIVLTLANIFVQPLKEMGLESYDQYIAMVFLWIALSIEFAFIVILFLSFVMNSNPDEKLISNNDYILKLLEDYVS